MKLYYVIFSLLFVLSCSPSDEPKEMNTPDPQTEEPTSEDPTTEDPAPVTDDGVMRNITPTALVADMGSGWNLGNTLDVEDRDETFWGNPYTTKAMIDAISAKGFKTIRVPVTWRFHMGDAPEYLLEEAWLNRVQEIIDYARSNGMYVIINIHHDDPWILPLYDQAEEVKLRLEKVWTQIANRFNAYSDYLIFETLNEPRLEDSLNEWSGGTEEGRDVVNQYHQVSVDAIRATGGNNANRKLMISSYAASTLPVAIDALIIPNNDPNTIISLHSYFPFEFCLGGTDTTWGTDDDKLALQTEFDKIAAKFIANGQPVIMGEWSSGNQGNTEDRLAHADFYAKEAAKRGIMPIWWDMGDFTQTGTGGSALFDRRSLTWPFGEIADAVINARN